MWIREKMSRGFSAFSLVESKRVNGKVRQRTIAYLGATPDLSAALKVTQAKLADSRRKLKEAQTFIDQTETKYANIPDHLVQQPRAYTRDSWSWIRRKWRVAAERAEIETSRIERLKGTVKTLKNLVKV